MILSSLTWRGRVVWAPIRTEGGDSIKKSLFASCSHWSAGDGGWSDECHDEDGAENESFREHFEDSEKKKLITQLEIGYQKRTIAERL